MSESVFYSTAAVRRLSDRIIKDYKQHYSFPETQEGFSPSESHLRDVLVDVLHEELNHLPSFMKQGKCSCVAGLPDPECPQHGVHSVQASAFYDNAYRVNIQSKCAQLAGVLHRELLDTGLVTVEQWNDKIASALVAVDRAVETPRQWAERVTAPLTPFGEAVWKLSVAILLRLEGICPALRGKALVADIYSLLAVSPIVQPIPEVSPTANSGGTT